MLRIYLGGIMMVLQLAKPQLKTQRSGSNLLLCLEIHLEKVTDTYVFVKISNQIEKLQLKEILEL